MINFRKCDFVTSQPDLKSKPGNYKPCVLFVGRSNVGKSTLINKLVGKEIAFSSKKAGKTKLINYFLVDDRFYLVDSPGYGSTLYANLSTINFAKMMEEFIEDPILRGIVLLLDLRHEPGKDDKQFIKYLQKSGVPLIYVLTKVDTMNQKELASAKKIAQSLNIVDYVCSKGDSSSLDPLKGKITSLL